jgi:hypothetical protein
MKRRNYISSAILALAGSNLLYDKVYEPTLATNININNESIPIPKDVVNNSDPKLQIEFTNFEINSNNFQTEPEYTISARTEYNNMKSDLKPILDTFVPEQDISDSVSNRMYTIPLELPQQVEIGDNIDVKINFIIEAKNVGSFSESKYISFSVGEVSANFEDNITNPTGSSELLLNSPVDGFWQNETKSRQFFESGQIDINKIKTEGSGPYTDYSFTNTNTPNSNSGHSMYLNTSGYVGSDKSQRVELSWIKEFDMSNVNTFSFWHRLRQDNRHLNFYCIINQNIDNINLSEAEYVEKFPNNSNHGSSSSTLLDWTKITIDVSQYDGVIPIIFMLRHSMSWTERADEKAWIWGLEFEN